MWRRFPVRRSPRGSRRDYHRSAWHDNAGVLIRSQPSILAIKQAHPLFCLMSFLRFGVRQSLCSACRPQKMTKKQKQNRLPLTVISLSFRMIFGYSMIFVSDTCYEKRWNFLVTLFGGAFWRHFLAKTYQILFWIYVARYLRKCPLSTSFFFCCSSIIYELYVSKT